MIASSIAIIHHRELIKHKGVLCTQIEAGNPFLSNQDLVLSPERLEPVEAIESFAFETSPNFDEKSIALIRESLSSSVNRAQRLPKSLDAANAVALDYFRMGEIETAIEEFKKLLGIDPEYFPAQANLAKCYSTKGDFDAALSVYMDLEKRNSEDIRVLMNIGLIYLNKRDFDQALTYLTKAHKIDPKSASVLNNIGLIHLIKRNPNKAVSAIREASRIENNDPVFYNNLGVCFVAQRNFKKAITNFKIAYLLNKDAKNIVSNLANAYQELGEHEKVITLVTDYLQADPEDTGFRSVLAWSLFQKGLHSKCLGHLKIILRNTDPENKKGLSDAFNNMGAVYTHVQDFIKAKECLLKSIEIDPKNDIYVYCNLLDLYFRLWELEKARALIDKAISVYSDHPVLLSYLGSYYRCIGEYRSAKQTLQEALKGNPKLLPPYLELSVIELDIEEDTDSALEVLENGLNNHPDSIPLVNNYAYCLILRGELAKAREVLDKHKEESHVPLLATRGLLLIKEGNVQEGRRLYNSAVTLAGNDKGLAALVEQKKNLELGIDCLEKNNKREAIRLFQKGLRYRSREDRYRKKIVELLEQLRD